MRLDLGGLVKTKEVAYFPAIDEENFSDMAEALHTWLTLNVDGKSSLQYELLSASKFKPGSFWTEDRVINENDLFPYIDDSNFETIAKDLDAYYIKYGS